MKKAILVFILAGLCAGCGNNFEWFPKNKAFQNASTAAPVPTPQAEVRNTVPFPAGVTSISDLVYDKGRSSFWLLAATIGTRPNAIVEVDSKTWVVKFGPSARNWSSEISDESALAFDGNRLWITSNGYDNSQTPAIPKSEIYQLQTDYQLLNTYPCPATSTGFCQGLVRDGANSSFWVAGSDNNKVVNFQIINGAVSILKTYSGLWSTNGISDMGFDAVASQLLVLKDGMIPVNVSSGAAGTGKSFIVPGNGRGDWDGSYFWVIDNTEKLLKAVVVK